MNRFIAFIAIPSLVFALGCAHKHHATTSKDAEMHHMMMPVVTHAIAVLHPTQGNSAMGTVHFMLEGDSIKIVADISNLVPGSVHAIHIHEFGDCSSPDGNSAGGHYDPEGHKMHGAPTADPTMRHAGDMGNITADGAGKAHLDLMLADVTISGKNAILGRSVILHAKADDFGQPTGNAGGRIACGVIGVAK